MWYQFKMISHQGLTSWVAMMMTLLPTALQRQRQHWSLRGLCPCPVPLYPTLLIWFVPSQQLLSVPRQQSHEYDLICPYRRSFSLRLLRWAGGALSSLQYRLSSNRWTVFKKAVFYFKTAPWKLTLQLLPFCTTLFLIKLFYFINFKNEFKTLQRILRILHPGLHQQAGQQPGGCWGAQDSLQQGIRGDHEATGHAHAPEHRKGGTRMGSPHPSPLPLRSRAHSTSRGLRPEIPLYHARQSTESHAGGANGRRGGVLRGGEEAQDAHGRQGLSKGRRRAPGRGEPSRRPL